MIIYSETYGKEIELIEITRETAEVLFDSRAIYYTTPEGKIDWQAYHSKVGNKWHVFPESLDDRYWIKKTTP